MKVGTFWFHLTLFISKPENLEQIFFFFKFMLLFENHAQEMLLGIYRKKTIKIKLKIKL
jgi:hypothetical protein